MIRIWAAVIAAAAVLWAPPANAVDTCSSFGGAVEQDGLCRVHDANDDYVLDMSFPVDFPTQEEVTEFLADTRSAFLDEVNAPDARHRPYGLDISAMLDASDTTESVTFEVYQNVGGAHPNTWYRSFNYDTVERRQITFDTLFAPGIAPLDTIFPIVQRELQARTGVTDIVLDGEGRNPANYRNFAVTPADLIFFFDRGALMAGAAGAHTVRVPRSEIPPLAV